MDENMTALTPAAEEGEREWEKHARTHIAQIQKRFPNRSNWVPTARFLERALAELDTLRESPFSEPPLLSSPRVEEVRREAFEEAEKVAETAAREIKQGHPIGMQDISLDSIAAAIRSLSPQEAK